MAIRRSGIKVISKTIGKFEGIINGLNQGIALCDSEVNDNDQTIQRLEEKSKEINTFREKATTFRDNLNDMMNNKKEE